VRRNTALCVLVVIALGAMAFRLPRLGLRPMHSDEAVHADKTWELWARHTYTYDPNEYHGPTLYYAALPSILLSGAKSFADTTEATYRIVPAVFGVGLVVLVWLFADGIGWPSALVAGVLFAISPALVYYSRYYIQETLLAFFTVAAIGAGWRYWRTRRLAWCLATGAALGLMHATKETCVLAYAAMAGALALTAMWSRMVQHKPLGIRGRIAGRHVVGGVLVGALLSFFFLSGGFTNMRGPLDSFAAYAPWGSRAEGQTVHVHPWTYYLRMLLYTRYPHGHVWSEGLIVGLAALGGLFAMRPQGVPGRMPSAGLVRYVAFFTLLLTAFYSAVPYKTPWCVLSFLAGMVLLAGVGTVGSVMRVPGRALKAVACALLVVGAGHLVRQAYAASYVLYADNRNPYVYAHPVPDVLRLAAKVADIARADPHRHAMVIKVLSVDNYYWPIPWYLRSFQNVGYWVGMPSDPAAPVVIASSELDQELTKRLDPTHLMIGYFQLRPSVFYEVWVSMDLWRAYLKLPHRVD